MKTRENIKKHLFFALIIAAVLFMSAWVTTKAISHHNQPQKITARFQKQISAAYIQLNREISQVENLAGHKKQDFFQQLRNSHNDLFRKKGIEILVYERDSLKYWSYNLFSAPTLLQNLNLSATAVKTGNGYYLAHNRKIGDYTIVGLQLIRFQYGYSNEYLPSGFQKNFNIPSYVKLSLEPGHYNIRNPEGRFICSLSYNENYKLTGWIMYLVLAMYIASLLYLTLALFQAYSLFTGKLGHRWLFLFFFVCDALILRFLQFYFKFPAELYKLELFSPAFFASSNWLPSLGDLLINVLLLLQLSVILLRHAPVQNLSATSMRPRYRYAMALLASALVALMFYVLSASIRGLVLNSRIAFSFEDFFSVSPLTSTGIFIIAVLVLSVLFLSELLCYYFRKWAENRNIYMLFASVTVILFGIILYLRGEFDFIAVLALAVLYSLMYFRLRRLTGSRLRLSRIMPAALLLAVFATYTLNKTESSRELSHRKILASHLSEARDNLAEFYYRETAMNIRQDKWIAARLESSGTDSELDELSDWISRKYFAGFWRKYEVQITICSPGKKLNIKPSNLVTDCENYFAEYSSKFMQPTSVPGLSFLRQSVDSRYYLGKITFKKQADTSALLGNIFIEIISAGIWKGLGYPELLTDRQKTNVDNLSGYSYAFYDRGELVKNVGRYPYPMTQPANLDPASYKPVFNENKFNHLIYRTDNNTFVVLSREIPRVSDLVSPFSYILLLLLLIILLIRLFGSDITTSNLSIHTFRWRLQFIMMLVIVVSSVILVTVSLLFINQLNRNKNNEILNEKLNSVLVDIESRYMAQSRLSNIPKEDLSTLLLNLSNTYFTDINLFDTHGYLLASSRDQVFREGMVSEQLNSQGACRLFVDKSSVFIQRENIGSYTFLSAYSPVRNVENKLIGYLNLPYFARQEEIRKEISGLISAFANIYIIMIIVTVMLALLLSDYFTKPLQQIGKQFSRIKIANQNAKIDWKRRDEIGQLVDEYNRMIDEMAESAEKLARSERESAWREMARQVAHEIKNPLTPIKLNMQLLLRAWHDKDPDWEGRLKRFSQTLIMQIDTLSSIASEFSDFATMPRPEIQDFDIFPLLHQTVTLFRNQSDCEIILTTEGDTCLVRADSNQVLRVLNNLMKNALQALPADRKGLIEIRLEKKNQYCEISVADNGTGIPAELQPRIFTPNFTTKTTGMGLGLAMVKNIMDGLSGKVWFESQPGTGTVFHIALPVA